jgi:hypothetical protein
MFSLQPAPASSSSGVTCLRCGRSNLRPADVLCTEDGFLCDGCHAATEAERSKTRGGGTSGCGAGGLVGDVLLELADLTVLVLVK